MTVNPRKKFNWLTYFVLLLVFANLGNLIYQFLQSKFKSLHRNEFEKIKHLIRKANLQNQNLSEKILNFIENERIENEFQNLRNSSLIFIGGFPRSGTTLMRAILDVHPSIKCGPETKILPAFLTFISRLKRKNPDFSFKGDDVKQYVVDDAISRFIYHIMKIHGQEAPRLCAKDPDIGYKFRDLHDLFPNAKFVYMIRDGRPTAYSYMKKINAVLNSRNFAHYLGSWCYFNKIVYHHCVEMGPKSCIMIRYEDLVLYPKSTIKRVIKFLNETWTDELLNHQNYIGDKVSVSKTEWSSDQVVKPINTDALTSWIGKVPLDSKTMELYAPFFKKFGYSLNIKKLNYGNKPS